MQDTTALKIIRKTWTVVNNKGGVGKTFLTAALAWALAHFFGLRVLCIDMDPQGNLTRRMGFTANETAQMPTMTEALKIATPGMAEGICVATKWEGFEEKISLLPARLDLETRVNEAAVAQAVQVIREDLTRSDPSLLTKLEQSGVLQRVVGTLEDPVRRLATILDGFADDFDVILIDCPPSLGHLTQMAYVASQGVLLVTKPDYDAVNGAQRTREQLWMYRTHLGVKDLDIHGLLVTDLRIVSRKTTEERPYGGTKQNEASIKDVQDIFAGLMWDPPLENRTNFADSVDLGVPIVDGLPLKDRTHATQVLEKWAHNFMAVATRG